jgi:hypothetical protein
MRNDCFDEGTIQAFLDGELASDLLENTARHLAICGDCAAHLAAAEEETAFAFSALEHEFNTLVPTQRLWTKINDSIERERRSFWNVVFAFFRNPALASFAAFLIVFGVFVAYMNSSNNNSADIASAPKLAEKPAAVISTASPEDGANPFVNVPSTSSTDGNGVKNLKVVEAKFDSPQQRTSPAINQKNASQPAVYEYLPGEESYIKTIVTLEKTVDDKKDEVLKPSSRVAYEKDLALVNDAIRKMQVEVRKNPKNETAKQVLLDSYQNKVDLLNSVTGRTELMASLR